MLPTKFQVNWSFGSGEKAINRFSRWPPILFRRRSYFLASLGSVGLSVKEKKYKIIFQDGSHLGFPIRTILAIFDLQVTPMVST